MMKNKQEYMLLFRGGSNWYKELSPEELQQHMDKMQAWFNGLAEKGLVKGGQPLSDQGRVLTGKGGRIVSDGPFVESKETVGGYMILLADSFEEAVSIAKNSPLTSGGTIEVRSIAEECPMMAYAREKQLVAV